ncbi:DUF2897 family protein [Psychrosphaera ytuae]|uniref:DUF2897 family protein n=1 Tax=Psychrosphaera ytuae TaxID=2820710 RepID=A0A975DCB6_9GAMM|nr:DUF2897 family protein [Psychrosphaera ytuae]QTH64339.1 DUF2897 family protein [Psychrosphaera ytuae]
MWLAIGLIVLVLGVVISNIMLLKHSSKFSMKNFNQDPIDNARQRLEEREKNKSKSDSDSES